MRAFARMERRLATFDRMFPRSTTAPTRRSTESLADFIARVAPRHTPIPQHLRTVVDVFERARSMPCRVLISMPPRHGKSVTAQAALAWLIQREPDRLNAYVSYAQQFANGQSRRIRHMAIEAGVRLADDAAAVQDWRTPQNGGLVATGIEGPLTGRGVTGVMVIDDPIKGREEAESKLQRDKVWDWFSDVANTRLEPGSSCIVIATRWHHDDLIGRLETGEFGAWERINLPAVRDPESGLPADEGIALWPEQYPLDALARIRRVNEFTWASLYQGHPVPRGGQVFVGDPARYVEPVIAGARIVLSVDAAGTASTRADFTAAVALAVRGFGDEMHADILEVMRVQKEPRDSAADLAAFQKRRGGGVMLIESTRDGLALKAALQSIDRDLRIVDIKPLGDKLVRAQPVASAWTQGRVRAPMSAPWLGAFLSEVARFTGINDPHDDQVDALSQAWNHAALGASTVAPRIVSREQSYRRTPFG